jgi:hypothetical protein
MKTEYAVEIHRYIPHDEVVIFRFPSPAEALVKFRESKCEYGERADVRIQRDGEQISEDDLRSDLEGYERRGHALDSDIEAIRQQEMRLPLTYRPGRGAGADIGVSADGPHGVWRPPTPR